LSSKILREHYRHCAGTQRLHLGDRHDQVPDDPNVRSIFRDDAAPAVAATAAPFTPASARAEDDRQPGAESLNGNGFYRFKIGDFQATVISDGYGELPVGPVFAMNVSEGELAPVLNANFMRPMVQVTNNVLVVDTGEELILVDTGFGEKIGPSFGSFPGLEENLRRAGIAPESIDLVVTSHGHLDHIGGLVTRSGALAFPEAQFVFVDTEWNYWTGIMDWHPQIFLGAGNASASATLKPAGCEKAQGALAFSAIQDPGNPIWDDQPGAALREKDIWRQQTPFPRKSSSRSSDRGTRKRYTASAGRRERLCFTWIFDGSGLLGGNGHAGAIYNATGPDRLSGAERAALIAEITGRPISFRVITRTTARRTGAGGSAGRGHRHRRQHPGELRGGCVRYCDRRR
jgi:hypothetical protein